MPLDLRLKDIVETKKTHPCGGARFEITRTGMDFRMICQTCKKEIWIERVQLEKRIKAVERDGQRLSKEAVKR